LCVRRSFVDRGSSAPAKIRSSQGRRCANSRPRLSRGSVAALGCIVYEVVKAHGSLPALSERSVSNGSTALADAKADLAKAEATVESLVTAAEKAV
jgi:hypothetical protein